MLKKILRELKKTSDKEKLGIIYKKINIYTQHLVQNKEKKIINSEILYLKKKYIYIIDQMNTKISEIKLNIIYSNWSSIFYSKKFYKEGTEILKISYRNLNSEILKEKNLLEKKLDFILVFGIVSSNLVMFYLKRENYKDAFFYGRNFNKKIRLYIKKNKSCFFEDEYLVYLFVQSFLVIAFCMAQFDCDKYKVMIFKFLEKSKFILNSNFSRNSKYFIDLEITYKNFMKKINFIFNKNNYFLDSKITTKNHKDFINKIFKNEKTQKVNFENIKKNFLEKKKKKIK